MDNPFIEFVDQYYKKLGDNPDATEIDFNGKAFFTAFIEKHPLLENEFLTLAWYAGDIISNRNQHG